MRRRPWFWRLTVVSTIIAMFIGLILMRAANHGELSTLHREIASYRPLGSVMRLLLIAALTIGWPRLVMTAKSRGMVNEETAADLRDARWRLLAWLLAAELLIGGNVLNVIATGRAL